MKLIKYEGYKLVVEPEALTIKVFKEIWKRDRSIDKNKAMSELAFIYFFADTKSDYQYIVDEQLRETTIKEDQGFPEIWKPDKVIKEAIEYYKSFKTTAELLLEDTKYAVHKLRILLRDIDLEERDDKGKPIYTLNTITATIKQVPSLIKDLEEAERAIAKEAINNAKMRGSGEKTLFEDGF